MKPQRCALALILLVCVAAARIEPGWSTARPLPEPIQELNAAVLDGKIYIAGGLGKNNAPTTHAYRYDPNTDTWERIADLPDVRHRMPLVVVRDTLYAVGGMGAANPFMGQSTLWAYLRDQNVWSIWLPVITAVLNLTASTRLSWRNTDIGGSE